MGLRKRKEAVRPSRVPDEAIDRFFGFTNRASPFVRPGERPPRQGPYMRRRKPGKKAADRRCSWEIVDRPTAFERRILGRGSAWHTEATGFKEGEEDAAADVFAMYLARRRALLLGTAMPMQVEAMTVLEMFKAHLESGSHGMMPKTVDFYWNALEPLSMHFGHLRLGEINSRTFKEYEDWRTSQPRWGDPGGEGDPARGTVSLKTAFHDLGTFRRALSHFEGEAGVSLGLKVSMPKPPRPEVTWCDRIEFSRYLWAGRGRVWNPGAGRWRILRDDDPSLAGPEGDARVLRSPEVVAFRKAMVRLMLMGVYSGGRLRTMLGTTYDDDAGAHVDWYNGRLFRKGVQEDENNKRRGSVLLPPKLARWLRNWARGDIARGIRHPIHKPGGEPFATPVKTIRWRELDFDAGLGMRYTAHVSRHTCAHWLKNEGVGLWTAAHFLDCSPKVVEQFYGKWDTQSHAAAAASLSGRSRQREMLREMRAAGLR